MKLKLFFLLILLPFFSLAQENNDSTSNVIRVGFQSETGRPAYPPHLNGRQVLKFEGNVIYTHKENGATITCDSAYHYYPGDTIEFFSNVIIQHVNTIVMGDKIFYDGQIAQVRGHLVVMQNQEKMAELRTQFVDYDLDDNIGIYFNGGTLKRNQDTIESINGTFNGNTNIFTFIDEVAFKNDSIVLACDTMFYDTNIEVTTFKENTKLWSDASFMKSNFGWYRPNEELIHFSDNAYIQSGEQEVWGDSIFYDRKTKNALLHNNIQIIDTSENVIIFGDKAAMIDSTQAVMVTKEPAALFYQSPKDTEDDYIENNDAKALGDTTYLVADTICSFLETNRPRSSKDLISTGENSVDNDDGFGNNNKDQADDFNRINNITDILETDSLMQEIDSLPIDIDSTATISIKPDTIDFDTLTNKTNIDSTAISIKPDTIDFDTLTNKTNIDSTAINIKPDTIDFDTLTNKINIDSISPHIDYDISKIDSISINIDSTQNIFEEFTIASDSLANIAIDTATSIIEQDTMVRNIYAYHNVKVFKTDFQALCDSLIYKSHDSVAAMYHTPILWSDSIQVSSGPSFFYSKNGAIDYAEFTEPPIIIIQEDPTHFNQIKGKLMKAYFSDNSLKQLKVFGNSQILYNLRENADDPISLVEVLESKDVVIDMIEVDNTTKIDKISSYVDVTGTTYPIAQIPEGADKLKGFEWHEDIRPKSKTDLFNRQIKPRQRKEIEQIKKPSFSITRRINKLK